MPFSFQILYEAVCFYPIVSNNYIPNICCMWTISKLPSCLVCICIVHVSVAKRGTCNGHGRWWIKQVIVFWSWISIFHVCQSRLFQCFIPNTPLSLPISISFNHVFFKLRTISEWYFLSWSPFFCCFCPSPSAGCLRCNLVLASEKGASRNLLEETLRLSGDAVQLTQNAAAGWRRPAFLMVFELQIPGTLAGCYWKYGP